MRHLNSRRTRLTAIALTMLPNSALAQEAPPTASKVAIEEVIVSARKRDESLQKIPVSVTPFSANQMQQRGFQGMEDIAAATAGFTFDGSITSGHHSNAVIRGMAPQFTIARVQNVSFFMDGIYLQRQSMLNSSLVDMERIEVVKGPQNALYGRNAFAGAVNYISARPTDEFEGYSLMTLGSDERTDVRFSASGPLLNSGKLLGRIGYGYSTYDGHTDNDHPVKDADPTGPNTRGRLGGWEDQALNLGLTFIPTDTLVMNTGFYRSVVEKETQPGYMISGVGAARFDLRSEAENDLNCNSSTQQNIQENGTVTGNTLLCGELPNAASDISARDQKGIVIDPRGMGALGTSEFYTFSIDWDFAENWTLSYLLGYARHDSETTGGPGGEDPIRGQSITTDATAGPPGDEATYTRINSFSGRPNLDMTTLSSEWRFDWNISESQQLSFGAYWSKVEDTDWVTLFLNSHCSNATPEKIANCNTPTSAPSPIATESVATAAIVYDQGTRQHGGNKGELTEFEDEVMAIFASWNISFNDKVSGTAEFRYTREDKTVERITDSFMLRDGESVTYTPGVDPVLFFGPGSTTISSNIPKPSDADTFTYFTPRFIVDYALTEEQMVYASLARGIKTGGFNNAEDPAQLRYDVAENITFEFGSKNQLLDRRLTLNAAFYYIDWTNLQGEVPPTNGSLSSSDLTTNLGDAISTGIEIESTYIFDQTWSVDVGYTYNHTSYKDGVKFTVATNNIDCDGVVCPTDGDVEGNQIPRTSKNQLSIGVNANFKLPMGWAGNGRFDVNYQSKQYVTPLNVTTMGGRTVANMSFAAHSPNDHWELNFWAKNVFDEEYVGYAFYIGIFNQYLVSKGPGRSLGATVKYML